PSAHVRRADAPPGERRHPTVRQGQVRGRNVLLTVLALLLAALLSLLSSEGGRIGGGGGDEQPHGQAEQDQTDAACEHDGTPGGSGRPGKKIVGRGKWGK